MKSKILVIILLMLSIVALSGCTDISDSYKPGSFGTTEEEMQIVDAVTEKYGDMTAKGEPRILELMMTSATENFIPVDKVLKYSQDSDELYAWFIYDNFEYDVISVEWIYLDDDYSIYTFESETGEDFGRGTFILEKPDDGWPLGNYKVIISGAGVEDSVEFEIIDGATASVPLDLLDDTTIGNQQADFGNTETAERQTSTATTTSSSDTVAGWYLVEVEDYNDVSDRDTFGLEYERGNVLTIKTSVDGDKTLQIRTVSEEPKDFYAAEEEIAIKVRKEGALIATGNLGMSDSSHINIDMADIRPGGTTAGSYSLEDETYGDLFTMDWKDSTGTVREGIFKANVPGAKAHSGSFAIIYTYYNGDIYGTKYTYEWRE